MYQMICRFLLGKNVRYPEIPNQYQYEFLSNLSFLDTYAFHWSALNSSERFLYHSLCYIPLVLISPWIGGFMISSLIGLVIYLMLNYLKNLGERLSDKCYSLYIKALETRERAAQERHLLQADELDIHAACSRLMGLQENFEQISTAGIGLIQSTSQTEVAMQALSDKLEKLQDKILQTQNEDCVIAIEDIPLIQFETSEEKMAEAEGHAIRALIDASRHFRMQQAAVLAHGFFRQAAINSFLPACSSGATSVLHGGCLI